MNKLFKNLRYFRPIERFADGLSELSPLDREWEKLYHQRYQFDKVIRTTHGVNCTGSCSWKVYVKDGIVTWETQQTDYPSTGPDMPEFEPRGCPRGATFSWYLYSPLRIKYPYIRGILYKFWQEAIKENPNDPVAAWASIVENPEKARAYKASRGKGGLVRASWNEVKRIIAAALIYTIKTYGPDRIAGVSPIPAMSMVSYAGGSRFLSLLGAPMLSFYDWYADLPPASPQIWGEQTDVPESSDWYNSGYLMIWGSNIPLTRTPDAHFMTEARYRGTKVISVSPDYAEYVKFADHWLPVKTGTDSALAQAMTHVILKEFYVDQQTEYFIEYAKQFTDLPYLVILNPQESGFVAGRFLRASDLNLSTEHPDWKPILLNSRTGNFAIPRGSIGHRWEDKGQWNLYPKDEQEQEIDPVLSLLGQEDLLADIKLPYFDEMTRTTIKRTIPAKAIEQNGQKLIVTTVYDLMLTQFGISRGLSGDYPTDYDDPKPYTPAWQEHKTGVDRKLVAQIAREFAQNAIDTRGRSMIIMGAGINQWYNSDVTYRAILNLVLLTGSQGVNGGGWAHYVGQEKCYPIEGWQTIAFARDWSIPPRLQNATSYYYFATEQWRSDDVDLDNLISPTVTEPLYRHAADYNVLAARLGWLPSYPQFDRNSLDLAIEARGKGHSSQEEITRYVAEQLKTGNLHFSIEDPGNPQNFPRVFIVWRSNLLTSSGKGHEYFLKHLLGTTNGVMSEENSELRPTEVIWRDEAPVGKLDLLVSLDFRAVNTPLHSDIVLPAATWYEKHDLSSTDMHPFIHPFNPAVSPLWESKPDWDIFKELSQTFSEMAGQYFSATEYDVVTTPLSHDSPEEIAQPLGLIRDWKKGEVDPIPGQTLPKLTVVERNYAQVYDKFIALGPLLEKLPIGVHGLGYSVVEQYGLLKKINGVIKKPGFTEGMPSLESDRNACETILTLSSATNGKNAMKAWEAEGKKTGLVLTDLAKDRAAEHFTLFDITAQPRQVITTPAFSGITTRDRRYSAFTVNIEHRVPFRTLTGRQHFYLDHQMMLEYGENLPTYKPPLLEHPFCDQDKRPDIRNKEMTLRFLTPHGKWNIHTTYQDNTTMLTLFRGGPNVWISHRDAEEVGIYDNDWVEVYNRNGAVVARAVVSHRMPRGTMFMYHAQDSHINVPGSLITNERGGPHNSPTRIHLKPTHMIGGYAQFSYGFNYYGPIGSQRDSMVVVRKLEEVFWLED